MKIQLGKITAFTLIAAFTVTSLFAATFEEIGNQTTQRQSGYTGPSMTRDEALLKKLEENAQQTDLGENDLQPERQKKETVKRPEIVVKNEPGDGLVKLRWVVLTKGGDQNLRFMVRVGTESEKYTKSLAVGNSTEYILRELRNFQPYFIQVIALDREQKTLFKSEEIKVITLPSDTQGSHIEKAFLKPSPTMLDSIEPERINRELKQFGYDFFKNSLQLTSTSDAMPAGSQYMLVPGDVVNLSTWGGVNIRQDLTVNRNGELTIPRVGPVRVWGLTVDKAKKAVNEAMNRSFRDYEMSLTLGKIGTIQVYVVGEVEAPGNYPVSSMSTVINVLAAAGGPSRNGSLRAVKVRRGAQTVATIDLYDMLLSGDRNKDVHLQNGDTIFVPVIGPVVAVAGEVRRPAIYELNGRTTIPDILKMAGGVAASGSLRRIQIERLENNSGRVVLDFISKNTIDAEIKNVELKDRDMVKVFPIEAAIRQVVVLKGNVQRTGEYQFRPGMRLTDLIPSTSVLLPESYLDSVEITRISPPDYQREILTVSLRRALAGNQTDNITLQEQDAVKIFSRWEMEEKPKVFVNGAVLKPGPYDFFPGMSVRDLVTAAGSAKSNAFLDQAELSRVVISADKAQSNRIQLNLGKALAGDAAHNLQLQSKDVLIVRGVNDWQDQDDIFVTLKGEVKFPGVYPLIRGEKLSSLIARAGGYTEKAYLRGAKFTRRSVREIQQKQMDEISSRTELEIINKQRQLATLANSKEEIEATRSALEGLQKGFNKIKTLKAEGRMVIRLSNLEDFKNSSQDVALEGGDELEIPSRPSVVTVLGYVYNPNSFVFQDGQDIGWYLNKTGGPVAEADRSEMYLVKADGTVSSRQQSSIFSNFLSSSIGPGDTLVVPQKPERVAWSKDIKDWTQMLANIAMSAGYLLIGLK